MWRELFASARSRGGSATRNAVASRVGIKGGQEKAMSSPRDQSGGLGPSAQHPQAAGAPVAPLAPDEAPPLMDESPRETMADVSRETSNKFYTPTGAAAERAM